MFSGEDCEQFTEPITYAEGVLDGIFAGLRSAGL